MFSFRRVALALLLVSATAAGAKAMDGPLPAVDGELAGNLFAKVLPGAPALRWTIAVRAEASGKRALVATAEGPGSRLRLRAELGDVTGGGTWTIEEGAIDVAPWWPALAPMLGDAAKDAVATGAIELGGGGELRRGVPAGVVTFALRDGRLHHPEKGWTLEGIALQGRFLVEVEHGTVRSDGPFELTLKTITTTQFGARNLLVRALLEDLNSLTVREARIEIAGGDVTVDPCTVPLAPLALDLTLRMTNVGLQDVAALVPASLTESRGRINGTVRVKWSEAAGVQIGDGLLELGTTEPAMMRLAPTPGFLTDRVPQRFELLPAWLGPVARWFRPENPAYADMRDIELGRMELRVESLSIHLTPEGDAEGRTARVRLKARPARPNGSVDEVSFEVNVAGPLAQVLRMGINRSFSVGVR